MSEQFSADKNQSECFQSEITNVVRNFSLLYSQVPIMKEVRYFKFGRKHPIAARYASIEIIFYERFSSTRVWVMLQASSDAFKKFTGIWLTDQILGYTFKPQGYGYGFFRPLRITKINTDWSPGIK